MLLPGSRWWWTLFSSLLKLSTDIYLTYGTIMSHPVVFDFCVHML